MLVNWNDDWNLVNNPDCRGLGWRQLRRNTCRLYMLRVYSSRGG